MSRDSFKASPEDRRFADAVRALIAEHRSGKPWPDDMDANASRVAWGIVKIVELIEREGDRLAFGDEANSRSTWVMAEVLSMARAIETGAAHPVWSFLRGVRAASRPTASQNALMRRATALVVYDLFKETGDNKFLARAVEALAGAGAPIARTTLGGWNDRREQSRLHELTTMVRARVDERSRSEGPALSIALSWAAECWKALPD